MIVKPIEGELLRFHVEGQNEEWYLVDLENFWSVGQCGCGDCEFRHAPILRLGKTAAMEKLGITEDQWPPERLQCKHVMAAYRYLGRELAVRLAMSESAKRKGPEEV